jgi:predicted peptidase
MALVLELMDKVIDEYPINIKRIYVTGLSMGGFGTWDLISRIPERIAAAAPVCGGGDETQAAKLVNIPIWVFHGADDPVVPTDRSRHMVQAIKDAGGTKIKYTEYPGVGHGSWKPAYADPEFLKWMFKQKK